MKSLMAYISHLPKRTGLIMLALMSVFVIGSVATATFGPDRPTRVYVQGEPGFEYVTFNSFTEVPNFGDEREFFSGKFSGGSEGGFYDPMVFLKDGDTIKARVYLHNNADGSLNESGVGIAEDVNVRVDLTDTDLLKDEHQATAYISSASATPVTVFDTLDWKAENSGKFMLKPVAGSGVMTTNDGKTAIDVNQLIGANGVNIGDIKGCFEYSAVITFELEVDMPRYEIAKTARFTGETRDDWREEVQAKTGDKVEFAIEFTNTGSTTLTDVIIKDDLPPYLTYQSGSTKLYNANHNGTPVGNDSVVANGINIGNYEPGANAIVLFEVEVDSEAVLECGVNRLTNIAFAAPANLGRVSDGAHVVVDTGKDCTESVYECTSLTAVQDPNNRLSFAFTTKVKHSEDVSVNKYVYNFGVSGEDKVHTDKSQITKVYKDYGKYNVDVEVLFDVDGEQKSDTCSTTVEVMKTPPVTPPVEPPVTPPTTELPNTGPASALAGLFGTGALGYGAYTFRASRDGLRKKILG